jgi:hypothetical protein
MFESQPDFNSGQSTLVAGRNRNATLGRARALMKFDPSLNIPTNALIQTVSLQLSIVHSPAGGSANSTYALHRLLVDWNEGTQSGTGGGAPATDNEVTWNSRFHNFTLWSAPGASNGVDFVTAPSATAPVTNSFGEVIFAATTEFTSDVQTWLNRPTQNHGWLLQSQDDETLGTARRFASREDPVSYPALLVNYLVPVRMETITMASTNVHVAFVAHSNQTHRVEFSTNLSSAVWQTLTNLPSLPTNRSVVVPDQIIGWQRYYRVVSE